MQALKRIPRVFAVMAFSAGVAASPEVRASGVALSITPQEAREIAAEAYIFFYPLVSMDVTRRQMANQGVMNQFSHLRAVPNAKFRDVVRSNFDTLYSVAWLDLTKGPVIISVPDTHGRYYLLPLLDMWSDVFAAPGARTSGTDSANFAVVPYGWTGSLPEGVKRIEAPTPYVWVIGRTQTNGVGDYAAVHKVQNGYQITPLALWRQPPRQVRPMIDPGVDMKTPPKVQIDRMGAADFFHYAAALTKVNSPHLTDWSQMMRLGRIGIVAGKNFDLAALNPDMQVAVVQGAAEGAKAMKAKSLTLAPIVNGWQMNINTMGVYGNYYLKRAIIAQSLLGANQPEDAVYPFNVADADGKPVTGGQNYVMHFAKAQLPPVYAFWSLTMYDADGFQVANSLSRFAIGDRDRLKYNADGSLDLYIQHTNPGAEKEANWLPAPASGALGMTLRLYAPKPQVLEGAWAPPPVEREP
jgi:hypothetical protein